MRTDLNQLPSDLPCPVDDGKADHLTGSKIPSVSLISTTGEIVSLFNEFQKPTVLFVYPRAGSPLEPNANPQLWDSIPGARGCTPQSCGFRDLYKEFLELGYKVYGLSIQSNIVQREFMKRNHIPFPILSDAEYSLTNKLNLPTFEFEGERLIKRLALIIEGGQIIKTFYPVFPPDKNAETVLGWLKSKQ